MYVYIYTVCVPYCAFSHTVTISSTAGCFILLHLEDAKKQRCTNFLFFFLLADVWFLQQNEDLCLFGWNTLIYWWAALWPVLHVYVCVFFFFVSALQWCTISHSRADKIVSKNPPDSNRDCERLLSVGAELQRRGIVSRKNQKYFSWLVSKFLSVVTEYYNELLIIFQDLLQQLCLVTICVTDRSEAFIVVCLRIHPHQRDHINIIQHKRLFVQSLCDWDESRAHFNIHTWIKPCFLCSVG